MLVSAIMVTGKHACRRSFSQAAIRCFLEQTHPDKELVIINGGGPPLCSAHPEVREIVVPVGSDVTLGDLRNIGLEQARGDLIIQWDDDDWHHPRRMEFQTSAWEPGTAVLLRQQIRVSYAQ